VAATAYTSVVRTLPQNTGLLSTVWKFSSPTNTGLGFTAE
jgi:hypothetical protein